MHAVALTGGIGSGKSTVAQYFSELGVDIISSDEIAHKLVQKGAPAYNAIIEHFGSAFILPSGELDRRKLRDRIFENAQDKLWLETLLHPRIREEIQRHVQSAKPPYCIVEIPLYFETSPNPIIERVLVVDVPQNLQRARAALRDNQIPSNIDNVIKQQVSRESRLQQADDLLDNSGNFNELREGVRQLHEKYLKIFQ